MTFSKGVVFLVQECHILTVKVRQREDPMSTLVLSFVLFFFLLSFSLSLSLGMIPRRVIL